MRRKFLLASFLCIAIASLARAARCPSATPRPPRGRPRCDFDIFGTVTTRALRIASKLRSIFCFQLQTRPSPIGAKANESAPSSIRWKLFGLLTLTIRQRASSQNSFGNSPLAT